MRQNRVDPLGRLWAVPDRGAWMGNRGCLHDTAGRVVRGHAGRRWITCVTEFRGRRRALMTPGRYTELFFLDEATAYAAGHRPCAECRRADYRRFVELWAQVHGPAGADAIDRALHDARLSQTRQARMSPGHQAEGPAQQGGTGPEAAAPPAASLTGDASPGEASPGPGPRTCAPLRRLWTAPLAGLPPGAMVLVGGAPVLVAPSGLWRWSHPGYTPLDTSTPDVVPDVVPVLTPAPLVALMRAGLPVQMAGQMAVQTALPPRAPAVSPLQT